LAQEGKEKQQYHDKEQVERYEKPLKHEDVEEYIVNAEVKTEQRTFGW
jgi:dsDNA-binding SOS-regulon protein